MSTKRRHGLIQSTVWVVLISIAIPSSAIEVDSIRTCGGGNYSAPAGTCWDQQISGYPCNRGFWEFNVAIPPFTGGGLNTITMDVNDCEVTSFTLGEDTVFEVPAGNRYSVLRHASIAGIILGSGGDFVATNAVFEGERARVVAEQGAHVQLLASHYSSKGFWAGSASRVGPVPTPVTHNWPLITATGPNTRVDLSSLVLIDAGFDSVGNDFDIHEISVRDGAHLDLRSVNTIQLPADLTDSLEIIAENGTLLLDALSTVESSGGSLRVDLNGSVAQLGNLSMKARGNITLGRASVLEMGHLTIGVNSNIILNGGSVLEMGNLALNANSNITLGGGSLLETTGLRASHASIIRLNSSSDLLRVVGDMDLGKSITLLNPSHAGLELGGDFSHAHTAANALPLGNSQVLFTGQGQQRVEVGGFDLHIYAERLFDESFGFGQMTIAGEANQPTAVLLVDEIDNGNRKGFYGDAEALYLFGKEGDDGLRILNGSTLYMNHLHVYAMLDGVMTDLQTLFESEEGLIGFDEGYICLGGPEDDHTSLKPNLADANLPIVVDSLRTCAGGNYSTPAETCWDQPITGFPRNEVPWKYNVTVPAWSGLGRNTLTMDLEECVVNALTLGEDMVFLVPLGHSYAVLNHAEISGVVHGSGGHFVATNAVFGGERVRIVAEQGAHVQLLASHYSSKGFWAGTASRVGPVPPPVTHNWPLITATDPNTQVDLSSIAFIDAGFDSVGNDSDIHVISVRNGAQLDLRSVEAIQLPADLTDSLEIIAENGTLLLDALAIVESSGGSLRLDLNGSVAQLGNLSLKARSNITLDGGSLLEMKGLNASVLTIVELRDATDLLRVTGDLDLGRMILISNLSDAGLELGGDFSYAHTVSSAVRFGNSQVKLTGHGPQKVEVGGFDLWVLVDDLLDDSFGFGQLLVAGEPNKPSAVLLVDEIENGNRGGFFGNAEALYLYGKEGEDGLQILNDSTLYMNRLHVYAMLNGEMMDLQDLFGPDETLIEFGEGFISLGGPADDPRTLTANGGFETGVGPVNAELTVRSLPEGSLDIDNWQVAQEILEWTHESYAPDSGAGERYVMLSGTGSIRQDVPTVPGQAYHAYFEASLISLTEDGDIGQAPLTVTVAGASTEFTVDHSWQQVSLCFVAADEITTLSFTDTGSANGEFGLAIDNVAVLAATPVDPNVVPQFSLTLSVWDGGTVSIDPELGDPLLFVGPEEVVLRFEAGESISLMTTPDLGWEFLTWEGLTENDTSAFTNIVMDQDISLAALFGNRNVLISGVTLNCPNLQIPVILTDLADQPVDPVDATAFSIYEDGVRKELTGFEQSTCPISFNLVLDYSGDMVQFGSIEPMEAAAKGFLIPMTDQDFGQIIKFSTDYEILTDFTNDKGTLERAIDEPFPIGDTNLFASIYEGILELMDRPGCRAVIAMTNGVNNIHVAGRTIDDLIDLARLHDIPVFCIDLEVLPRLETKAEEDLRRIAAETGGLYFKAPSNDDLEAVYGSIAEVLKNQYVLTFESGACDQGSVDGTEHHLEIRVGGGAFFGRAVETVRQPAP